MSEQVDPLPEALTANRESTCPAWEAIKGQGTPASDAIAAFEASLANARQAYEIAVIEAWKKFHELGEEPDQWPPGYQGSITRRKTVVRSWQCYEEELTRALDALEAVLSDGECFEHGVGMAAAEHADLGGSVPADVQDVLDRVQEDISWAQDMLSWVQQVMDESPDETQWPEGCPTRHTMNRSREATGQALQFCADASDAPNTHQAVHSSEVARDALEQTLTCLDELGDAGIGSPDPDQTAVVFFHLGEVEQCLEQILYDLSGAEAELEYSQIPQRRNNWLSLSIY